MQSINAWQSGGNLQEAKDRMINAFKREDDDRNFLWVGHLGLTNLPPVIGEITSIRNLQANDNQLETIPSEIGNLTRLGVIRLDNNILQSIPSSIGRLTLLAELYLFNNQLCSLPPEIGLCRSLRMLCIQNNPDLRELPMSLGQLPELTYLDTGSTGISRELRDSIVNQCKRLRSLSAIEMLPIRLNTWKTVANSSADLAKSEMFTNVQKIDLYEWLVRLERTRDYSRSQARLAGIVCSMLQTVCESEEFKELFFAQVGANNACCQDRAAMSLNEIYTSWKSGAVDLKIMTGVAKTLALRKELAKRIPAGEAESVEIYLYYETLFKDHLCTAIEGMAHASIGKRDWIDEEELMKRVNETFFDHLMELPVFEKLVEVELKSEWERIVNMAQDCPEGDELSEAVLKWQVEVMHERKRAWFECVKRWYDHAVNQ